MHVDALHRDINYNNLDVVFVINLDSLMVLETLYIGKINLALKRWNRIVNFESFRAINPMFNRIR